MKLYFVLLIKSHLQSYPSRLLPNGSRIISINYLQLKGVKKREIKEIFPVTLSLKHPWPANSHLSFHSYHYNFLSKNKAWVFSLHIQTYTFLSQLSFLLSSKILCFRKMYQFSNQQSPVIIFLLHLFLDYFLSLSNLLRELDKKYEVLLIYFFLLFLLFLEPQNERRAEELFPDCLFFGLFTFGNYNLLH